MATVGAEPGTDRRLRAAMGTRRFRLILVALTVLTLVASFALKRPCAELPWNGQQYRTLCYNDIQALGARHLDRHLFPYVVENPGRRAARARDVGLVQATGRAVRDGPGRRAPRRSSFQPTSFRRSAWRG